MKQKNWFEIDSQGLKNLFGRKNKTFILRELVQNAFDENITECKIDLKWNKGIAIISVEDDSPEGFRDLTHAYILFGDTYKRRDAEKRGRFNIGEKLVFCVSKEAKVETTKGTIIFDKKGRHKKLEKRDKGSKITIKVSMTKYEFNKLIEDVLLYIPPKNIKFMLNKARIDRIDKYLTSSFKTILTTEIEKNNVMTRTKRKTVVDVYKLDRDKHYIYEMGIPITEIDCEYDIDIQQKIPLSLDRETVLPSFLKDVYAEVLNHMYDKLTEDNAAETWVNIAISDDRINKDAVETVLKKRYGEKIVVGNQFDPNSIDDAISHGFRVVRGGEFGKEIWEKIKRFDLLKSTSDLFGTNFNNAPIIVPNDDMKKVARLSKKIAKAYFNIDITVNFVKGGRNMVTAQYGNRCLTFNITKLGNGFFSNPLSKNTISLILHELGHERGNHTESNYHECLTDMAGWLIIQAIKEPTFYEVK